MIILHEIYGVNEHIKEVCLNCFNAGYDIYCPDLLNRELPYSYAQAEAAYLYFTRNIGFGIYSQVDIMAEQLKRKYEKVLLLGFSIGATIAWRCSANGYYDGMIGYYGSRIRDYRSVMPGCPSFLLFAEEDSFDVAGVVHELQYMVNVKAEILKGKHGFMDAHSINFNQKSCEKAWKLTQEFLAAIG